MSEWDELAASLGIDSPAGAKVLGVFMEFAIRCEERVQRAVAERDAARAELMELRHERRSQSIYVDSDREVAPDGSVA